MLDPSFKPFDGSSNLRGQIIGQKNIQREISPSLPPAPFLEVAEAVNLHKDVTRIE